MSRYFLIAVALLGLAALATAQQCPASSKETSPGLCFCETAAVCTSVTNSSACLETPTGTDYFPKACTNCTCILGESVTSFTRSDQGRERERETEKRKEGAR